MGRGGALKVFLKRRGWALLPLAVLAVVYYQILPKPLFPQNYSTVVMGEGNDLLGARLASDEQWRFPVSDALPKKFEACLLLQEDRYYRYHPGFNPVSFLRAIWLNAKAGKVVSGGSTITMQLVRLSRGNPPRTLLEKLYETVLATRLEWAFSKDEILRMYAAHAPFGGNTVGYETAAWRYYQRQPLHLSWAENATLAVLPNAPGLIHPGKNRNELRSKRNKLLLKLKDAGYLSQQDYELALLEEIPLAPEPLPTSAFHLTEYVHRKHAGQRVNTQVNKHLQNMATNMVNTYVSKMRANKVHNAALLLIDNEEGEVLAYVGNCSQGKEHFNDMLQTPRSSGSVLKPFLYAAMLQSGELLPSQLLPDIPTFIGDFQPKNFENDFDGAVPADEALARSLNIPAVHALKSHSPNRFLKLLRDLQFSTFNQPADHYGLSLILGGGEVTAWELGGAYFQLAQVLNKTKMEAPKEIKALSFAASDSVLTSIPLHAGAIWQTLNTLKGLNRPASEAGWEKFGRSKIAWKTGTSFGFRDAWAVGLSAKYTCVVWVGNATGEGRPGVIGAEAAGPLLFNFMNSLQNHGSFNKPLNFFDQKNICSSSGLLAGLHCPDTSRIYVPRATQNQSVCSYHKKVFLSAKEQQRVSRTCYDGDIQERAWFVLPPVQAWYYAKKHPEYQALPDWHRKCAQQTAAVLDVIYPRPNANIYIPLELDGEKGRVVIEVAHQNRESVLYWHLNGEFLGESKLFHQKALALEAGKYTLLVEDNAGNYVKRSFQVLEKDR